MEIPQEIIDSRVLTVKPDTELELIISVEYYNSRMALHRKQILGIFRLERIFFLLNVTLLIAIGVIGIRTGGVFIFEPRVEWLEYTVLGLYVAAFVWFGMIKRNLIALTAFSILLIFMDVRCLIMAVVNIVLTVFHEIKLRGLKGRQGFPMFRSIHIEKAPEQTVQENSEIPLDKSEQK